MKRLVAAILLPALFWPGAVLNAQEEVLKPFKKKPESSDPAVPLKPFKAKPVRPENAPEEMDEQSATAGDENIPKAVPIKKPTAPVAPPKPPTPAPAPVRAEDPPAAPAKPAPPAPAPPKPVPTPAPDFVDSGDIVIRPGPATSPDQVQLQLADNYFAQKKYKDAAAEYERYVQQFPGGNPAERQSAYYRLAESYRHTDALNNAKTYYDALLTNFATGEFVGLAAYRLGELLYAEKDYNRALPQFRAASVRLTQPTAVNAAKFYVARCLEWVGQKVEARQTYLDLSAISANNPFKDDSRLSHGRLLVDGGRREEAVKVLQPLSTSAENPQIKAKATAYLGITQLELGKLDAAAISLNAASPLLEEGPLKESVRTALYRVLYDKKDFKGIVENFTKEDPAKLSAETKVNLLALVAGSHRELKQLDQALAVYEQIIKEQPGTNQAREAGYERLIILYGRNDPNLFEEANAYLNANPTSSQYERISLMKAEALFKKNDFQNAAPIYQELVDKSRGLSGNFKGSALFKLGWCYSQLGNYDKAVPPFTTFLKDHPTHAEVPGGLTKRGEAHARMKQYALAQKDFEDVISRFPKSKYREYCLESLGLMHQQLGDDAKMVATFEILLKDFPEAAAKTKAHFNIGDAAFRGKDYKKAATHLAKARELEKDVYLEKTSLKILACYYNTEDVEATAKELENYKTQGGKAPTPIDVLRWVAQKFHEKSEDEKAERYFVEIQTRNEVVPEDLLQLARSRHRLKKYPDAIASYDAYLAKINDPAPRARCLIEKADTQIAMKDWTAVEKTVKEALRFQPEGKLNGEARLRAGDAQMGLGAPAEAAKIYEGISLTLEDEEITPRAIEKAVVARKQLGQEDEVKRLENQLRSRYPEYVHRNQKAKP